MGRSHGDPGADLTNLACQVVPDLATFAVDDGFSYAIPEGLPLDIGDRVRIRVSGRRRKGFVTAVYPEPAGRDLLPVDDRIGSIGSFSAEDLPMLRWCASHYVAPLSTILRRTLPRNNPKSTSPAQAKDFSEPGQAHPPRYHVGAAPHDERVLSALRGRLNDEQSALVIGPSVAEVESLAAVLDGAFGGRVVVSHSESSGAAQTAAWDSAASVPGTILVGTREVALWPVTDLCAIAVIEDARRLMRSPATPTLGVREIALARSRQRAIPIEVFGPLPSLELVHGGAEVVAPPRRWWPLVEVLDRREEPPSSAPLLASTRAAVSATVGRGGRAFVLVPRRGDAAAFLCMRCGTVRACPTCRSAASSETACLRCGSTLQPCSECDYRRFRPIGAGVGSVREALAGALGESVGSADDGRPVIVGTERDLIGVSGVDLAVAVGFDGSAMAPNYLAAESTLRLLVRLVNTVRRGSGNRAIIQTADPAQPVIRALTSGSGSEFLSTELGIRANAGFPPIGQLLALEIEIDEGGLDEALRASVGRSATVLGPASVGGRQRWLLQAPNLDEAKIALRSFVHRIRDRGGRVRLDVDPMDL